MQIFDLIARMRSIQHDIEVLKEQETSIRGCEVDTMMKHHQQFLEEQFDILRQTLSDTIQAIGAEAFLDFVPATPPLEPDAGTVPLIGSKRKCAVAPPSRGTRSDGTRLTKRSRQSRGDARLPLCLQELYNPLIGDDKYVDMKAGAFMTANILVLNLKRLQPRVQVVPMISHGTILVFHEAISLYPSLLSKATSDKGGLATLVCAAFWVLAKFGGVRGVTPDAALVSMAAGIKQSDLKHMEFEIMNALGWDILRPLKRHAHLGVDVHSFIM